MSWKKTSINKELENQNSSILYKKLFETAILIGILLNLIFIIKSFTTIIWTLNIVILLIGDSVLLAMYGILILRISSDKSHRHIQVQSLVEINKKLEERIKKLEVDLKENTQMAYYDITTGLPNRRYGMKLLDAAIKIASIIDNKRIAVLIIDIDNFKYVNDTLGHPVGDKLLIKIGERIKINVENYGTVFRLGGDEFMILVDKECTENLVIQICNDIKTSFSEPVNLENTEAHVSSSIGVALYPDHGIDVDTLIKHADIAMYKSKQRGRNTYRIFRNYYVDEINRKGSRV